MREAWSREGGARPRRTRPSQWPPAGASHPGRVGGLGQSSRLSDRIVIYMSTSTLLAGREAGGAGGGLAGFSPKE